MTTAYYRPSGKISASFFLYYILLLAICIPIISVVYIYATFYIPFIYANVLVTAGCGIVMAFLLMEAVKRGKARNPIVVLVSSLLAVCVLNYVKWTVYIPLVLSEVYGFTMTIGERFAESFFFLVRPGYVWDAALFINEFGVWAFEGTAVTGGGLLVVWILEFAIIAGLAMMALGQAKLPFSEEVGDWYFAVPQKVDLDIPENFDSMKSELETGRFTNLVQQVKAGRTDGANFLLLSFYQPPEGSFSESYYMDIEESIEKKGKPKTKVLVKLIGIDARSAKEILADAEAVFEEDLAEAE